MVAFDGVCIQAMAATGKAAAFAAVSLCVLRDTTSTVVDGFPINIHVRYLSLSTDIHDDAFKLLVDE